jgi:hypothetical protein
LLAVIFDEVALWRDEVSATPDIEVYRAVLPALMTIKGMLIGISTPYRKTGLLYQKHRDYYGVSNDDVLAIQGPSTAFNPNLTPDDITQAVADDPEGASSEWEATFRTEIATFLDEPTIEAAIDHDRPLELPPRPFQYTAFTDVSGGRRDAYTLCIGHLENELFIADVVRGTKSPLDPVEVTGLYAKLLRDYRCTVVSGDAYAEAWVEKAWQDQGIVYKRSELKKSQLYLESLPLFTRGLISIPDFAPLLRELRLLERTAHRGGRDSVDHPKNGSDDYANALCGCAATIKSCTWDVSWSWVSGPDKPPEDPKVVEQRRARLVELLKRGEPVPLG